jgi:hypothetical protein
MMLCHYSMVSLQVCLLFLFYFLNYCRFIAYYCSLFYLSVNIVYNIVLLLNSNNKDSQSVMRLFIN